MATEVQCDSCHENIAQGYSPQEIKQSCVNCHGPGYDKIVEKWQPEISERVRRTKRHLLVLRAKFRHSKTDVPEEITSTVKKAETIIELVERDKSRGAHNFLYSKGLVVKADNYLLRVKRWYARKSSSR